MEEQTLTALSAIDLSAAFNTVDHEVLIWALQYNFGLDQQVLQWYKSYLQPRGFKVCINNKYSIPRQLTFSVPQGSINGAPMYSGYASTVQKEIPQKVDNHGFISKKVTKHLKYRRLKERQLNYSKIPYEKQKHIWTKTVSNNR